jgi:putative mRNA 3-end processing factor
MPTGPETPRWIKAEREGLHLPTIGWWIDPSRAVANALVTHGHADHARGGHGEVWATAATRDIIDLRYGTPSGGGDVAYGECIEIGDSITATFLPAGHVLGSAQILLERQGERIIVTGDYKRRPDPTCAPFTPAPCDILITEATFALPIFTHPPIEREIARLRAARDANPDRTILVGAYALGKAQRVIAELRRAGYHETIWLHGAMTAMCDLYQRHGVALGPLVPVSETPRGDLKGQIVICPPSALNSVWARRLPDPVNAVASGWMRVRQRAVQSNVELPLIISDHCDWNELTATILEVAPQETWITHGREDALLHWCAMRQIRARALDLVGREDEDEAA